MSMRVCASKRRYRLATQERTRENGNDYPNTEQTSCEELLAHLANAKLLPVGSASRADGRMLEAGRPVRSTRQAAHPTERTSAMPFIDPSELAAREPKPGWTGRFFHSEHMTFAYYDIVPGSAVHPHHHDEEEVWHVIEGELEMALDGTTRIVGAGEAVVVPSGVEHGAAAKSPCRVIIVD